MVNVNARKRTQARQIGTRWAKYKLNSMGIKKCELSKELEEMGYENKCLGGFTVALAHDDKGRYLSLDELMHPDLGRVCLACSYCHEIIEYQMPRLEMQEVVRKVAGERNKKLMVKTNDNNNKKKEKRVPDVCPYCKYSTGGLSICPHCHKLLVK